MPFSSLLPTKLMAGSRAEAVRRVRRLGLVPRGLGSWQDLITTVTLLPDALTAVHLLDFLYLGLPGSRRPPRQLWEAVMPHLRRCHRRGPQPGWSAPAPCSHRAGLRASAGRLSPCPEAPPCDATPCEVLCNGGLRGPS